MLSQRTLCSPGAGSSAPMPPFYSLRVLGVCECKSPGDRDPPRWLFVTAIRSVNEIIAAKNQFGVNYKSLMAIINGEPSPFPSLGAVG